MLISHNIDPQQVVNGGTNTFGADGLGGFTPSGEPTGANNTQQRHQDISPLTAYTQDKNSKDNANGITKQNHFTTGRGSNDDLAKELADTSELPKVQDLKGWANKKDSTHTQDEFLMRKQQVLSRERYPEP